MANFFAHGSNQSNGVRQREGLILPEMAWVRQQRRNLFNRFRNQSAEAHLLVEERRVGEQPPEERDVPQRLQLPNQLWDTLIRGILPPRAHLGGGGVGVRGWGPGSRVQGPGFGVRSWGQALGLGFGVWSLGPPPGARHRARRGAAGAGPRAGPQRPQRARRRGAARTAGGAAPLLRSSGGSAPRSGGTPPAFRVSGSAP